MLTVRTRAELRRIVDDWRAAGAQIAIVPTMGALHAGHTSLVALARQRAERVIATIFVNPMQFDQASDLAAYPRSEAEDTAKLEALGVDLLYAPGVEQIYPEGFETTISVTRASCGLCGDYRPGHFDGVATVVTKLFLQTAADLAVFGEKDYQQLHIVRRLARDLDIPVEIVAGPTVREPDGLALSSRNVRLTPDQRAIAPALPQALFAAAERLAEGGPVAAAVAAAGARILHAGFEELEYLELRDEATLRPLQTLDGPARLLAAAWLGGVRLIDNVAVAPA